MNVNTLVATADFKSLGVRVVKIHDAKSGEMYSFTKRAARAGKLDGFESAKVKAFTFKDDSFIVFCER